MMTKCGDLKPFGLDQSYSDFHTSMLFRRTSHLAQRSSTHCDFVFSACRRSSGGRDIEGKTVIVTGASSGIGRDTALLLAKDGANVVLSDVDVEGGEKVAEEARCLGGNATFLACDVSIEGDVHMLLRHTIDTYGRLHGAVNNAGILGRRAPGKLEHWDVEELDSVMRVNVRGVFLCMKYELLQFKLQMKADSELGAQLQQQQQDYSIVNTSSAAGLRASPGLSCYAASKHAVMGLTRTAAQEYAPLGVRVNAVNPAVLDTPMADQMGTGVTAYDLHRVMKAANPMKRYGAASDASSAIRFLLSPGNTFLSGTALSVDGGLTA